LLTFRGNPRIRATACPHSCNDEFPLIDITAFIASNQHSTELRWILLVSLLPDCSARGDKEIREDHPMRSKLLVSTAALLAGMAMASAQNMQSGGRDSGPAAQSQGAPGGAAGQDRQAPPSSQGQRGQDGQAQQGQQDRMQRSQQKDQTTGQAPQKDQGAQGKDSQQDKAQPQRSQGKRDQTTGQGQRDQSQSPSQTQQSPTQQGQSPQRQQGQGAQQDQGARQGQGAQQGQGTQGQAAQPGQAQQGQAGSGNVNLTTEQRTKIKQTVLTGSNVPRATNVNFSISVGTVVPRSVRVVAVPTTIVEIHPQWRGFLYFVVGDEIIIVDRNHRIVAVIAV
jgi:hypothetical protein